MKKIKRNKDKICILKEGVNTSTRRYEREGLIYSWLRNHRMRFLYFLGVSPERLARLYPDVASFNQGRQGIVFFLRYPQEGEGKRRLAKTIGESMTLKLYQCFVRDTLDKLECLPYDLHLFVSPPEETGAMAKWLGQDLPLHAQKGEGLGERMRRAFEKMFHLGYESCVLMGSDFPDLPASVPVEAFEGLAVSEAVIAPAMDGGYYLLGFERDHLCNEIFENMPWSTDQVFDRTMAVLRQKKIRVKILRQWWDVDDYQDLEQLLERNRDTGFRNSRTMRFLLEHKKEIFEAQHEG